MTLSALMVVREDDWVLPFSSRVALQWVDRLHILIHASPPSTHEIVESVAQEHPGRVSIFIEPEPIWNEMNHRQVLLEQARRVGATHLAIIDADEILTGNLLGSIRGLVARTPMGQCLSIPKIDCWHGLGVYRSERIFHAALSLAFPDRPDYSWKPRRTGYQHHCRPPQPLTAGFCPQVEGGIFHLQFARPRALRAKQAYYKMVELLRWPEFGVSKIDAKYSWWDTPTASLTTSLTKVPEHWWKPYQELLPMLDLSDDGNSWHEREISRLIRTYGRERFSGLNLFGIVQ